MSVGIDRIACYCPSYYLDLKTLASLYEKDPAGYYDVLGQEKMAVPEPDADPVTLGANAAWQILQDTDKSSIKTLYFATESGIDQSKAAGMYLHRLLGLGSDCRVVELKQACYSATFALRSALQDSELNPDTKSLIVASDIARYGLGNPGEPTQGAGSCAMLISSNPKIMKIGLQSGVYTEDSMDFWRPNYRTEAFVDGQYSVRLYLKSFLHAYEDYAAKVKTEFNQFGAFCFHLPFSTIAEKAFVRLAKKSEVEVSDKDIAKKVHPSLMYNRQTGNCYTASLYQGICSLLDNQKSDLAAQEVGLFSYGSGSIGEFFTGTVVSGYKNYLSTEFHQNLFKNRKELNYEEYKKNYDFSLPQDGQDFQCPRTSTARYRLAGIKKHKRIYETQKFL